MNVNIAYYSIPGLRRNAPINHNDIIFFVCDYFNMTREQLFARNRARNVREARFMCFVMMRHYTTMTLKAIGQVFKLDHTTVIHGITTHKNLMDTEDNYKERYEEMQFLLKIKRQNTTNAK